MNPKDTPYQKYLKYSSPARLLAILVSAVFIVDAFVMALLAVMGFHLPLTAIVIDPLLLVLILFPVLYWLVVRQHREHVLERMQADQELEKIHVTLEQQVAERTRELDLSRKAALQSAHDAEEARKLVEAKARQHVILATLGQFALTASGLQTLMDEIVVAVSRTVGVEFCQILELLPDGRELVMRAGLGWKEGTVGQAAVESGTERSLAGHTISSRWAIFVEDLKREQRFSLPRHLLDHGVESGLSVAIEGAGGRPYGVLGAFTKVRRTFSQEDAHFLEAVANILSSCIRRKRSEETLKQSEEQSRLVIETAHDAFIGIDAEGSITDWNRKAEVLFGWSRLEAVGRRLADTIIPAHYREAHAKGLQHFLATGEGPVLNKKIEISALRRDGYEFPVELTVWPVKMGETIRFNAFIHDITARKLAAEELKNMQAQLIQSEKAALANQLAAGVAHEVKNPLAILLQGIEYLTENLKGNGKADASILDDMGTAVRRADSIIKGLLDLAAPARLTLEWEDVNSAVESALMLVKGLLERNRIRVVRNLNTRIPKIEIDRGKLIQALINLFSNSAAFMPEGGELGVKTYLRNMESGGKEVIALEVEDTGPGVPEEHLAKVFEPFFTTRRAKGGTGLGLSVVKNIVELHQGTIEIGNKEAGGAVVTMTFPVSQVVSQKR